MTRSLTSMKPQSAVVSMADMLAQVARLAPTRVALTEGESSMTYHAFDAAVEAAAAGLTYHGVKPGDRVAIFLEKSVSFAVMFLAAMRVGAIGIPINPLYKERQVAHIMRDADPALVVTSRTRLWCVDETRFAGAVIVSGGAVHGHENFIDWDQFLETKHARTPHFPTDGDPAAILYTSGSTGAPKGVVLSHRNLVAGAQSVRSYLELTPEDRILSLLPMSFDAGLSQLTSAIAARAQLHLMTFLRPETVVGVCIKHRPTVITGVPPLWHHLVSANWPEEASSSIRIVANTGGRMPPALLHKIQSTFPSAQPYLMYGLTEAFRSTYLDPSELSRRPGSIGKSVPNAHVHILRDDGTECDIDEVGELVHRGAFVALGYWKAPGATAERFRLVPDTLKADLRPELAVWSGDLAKRDAEGFLYFLGRRDTMIKTSGYRVSPSEIEDILLELNGVADAMVFAKPHPIKEQSIIATVFDLQGRLNTDDLLKHCAKRLPSYMIPAEIFIRTEIPRNANGKIDREKVIASIDVPTKPVSVV